MMSKDIMCPYFREPCLREGCTAFSVEERLRQIYADGQPQWPFTVEEARRTTWAEKYIYEVSHCSVLGSDLPERANNA